LLCENSIIPVQRALSLYQHPLNTTVRPWIEAKS
jgi:hypothetical protein